MDPQLAQVVDLLQVILPSTAIMVALIVAGSVVNNWLKIKNGYPLSNSWGMPIHPKTDRESAERISLLTNENAQLRAQIGALTDRLETVERIITDHPNRLAREIEGLSIDKGGNA